MSDLLESQRGRPQFPQRALLDPIATQYVYFMFGRGPTEKNSQNQTPLAEAASKGDEASVFMILCDVCMHSDIDIINAVTTTTTVEDKTSTTTSKNARLHRVVNATSDHGWSALHEAASVVPPNEAVLHMLLKYGADCNLRDDKGYSALHFGVEQNSQSIVEMLLQECRNTIQVDCTDYFIGQTPLHMASMNGNAPIVSLLLNAGAAINRQSTYLGRTPLHLAAEKGHEDVVELLLQEGADASMKDEDIGDTPLHLSCGKDREYEEDYLFQNGSRLDGGIDRVPVVKLLIKPGNADVNAKNNERRDTPLHCAVRAGVTMVVHILIAEGADVNAVNIDGRTPLHEAAEVDDVANAKQLIEHGADLNARDVEGVTPLDLAKFYSSQTVKQLIEHKMMYSVEGNNLRRLDHPQDSCLFHQSRKSTDYYRQQQGTPLHKVLHKVLRCSFPILLMLLVLAPPPCYAAHSRRRFVVRRDGEARYDRSITTFSPDGRLAQVEYGMEASLRGSTVAAMRLSGRLKGGEGGDDVDVLCVIVKNASWGKVHRLDHHLWLITAGLSGDSRTLANELRKVCQKMRLSYGEAPTTKEVAHISGQIQHDLTRYAGARPFGCSAIVAGVDPTLEDGELGTPHLYHTDPGGIVEESLFCAAGKGRDSAMKQLANIVGGSVNDRGKTQSNDKESISNKIVEMAKHVLKEDDGSSINSAVDSKSVDVWVIEPDGNRRGSTKVTCYRGVTLDTVNKLQNVL